MQSYKYVFHLADWCVPFLLICKGCDCVTLEKERESLRLKQVTRHQAVSVPGKALAHLLLMQIRSQQLKLQRPKESGFILNESTTDGILAPRVLLERLRVFGNEMLVTYTAKAFDSVHHGT